MIHVAHKFYWFLPLFSALVWLGMLLGMLLYWIIDTHSTHYVSMDPAQTIAYISNVGANRLQPLFIAGSTVTVVCLDAAMIAERWLRHTGRLAPNTSWFNRGLSLVAILCAIAGALGIILLSIYDVRDYPQRHDACLGVFIVGYVLSAIFICAEYQRLGVKYRQHFSLRLSFWYKLVFIIIEIVLAIVFGVYREAGHNINIAAIIEWIVALVFTGYILSFCIDLVPAFRNHSMQSQYTDRKGGAPTTADLEGMTTGQQMQYQNDTVPAANGYGQSGYRTAPAQTNF